MHTLTLRPAAEVTPATLHAAFIAGFSDYLIGPFEVPFERWPQFLARQGVDIGQSRVACNGQGIAAFALVAPRPGMGRWRLATMGAVPAARGTGAAARLLDDFLHRAAAAGQQAVELEVFAQNERAVRLYRSRDFAARHALHGYQTEAPAGMAAERPNTVREVGLAVAWGWLDETAQAIPDLPLQVTPPAMSALAVPPGAWRSGDAQLVFGIGPDDAVTVHSLVDRSPGQVDAELLVRALLAAHPGRMVKVPALQRPDLGGDALRRAGFTTQALHQWWMSRAVTLPGP